MKKIKKKDFNSWKEYYWKYQYTLASKYYIPELEKVGIDCINKKILEIGCGNGGFIAAFNTKENRCYGIDIKDMKWEEPNGISYKKMNIFDNTICASLDTVKSLFDIIILKI